MPEVLDIIAVGAHPDDVEIGCGGTLANLVAQGYNVGIIDLTNGEPTPNCPHPEIRVAEAHAAADKLGCKRYILNFENRNLFDSFEPRVELAKLFRIHKPKVVLGILGKTPMASPDHWQASQITDAAVFYSRLTKWDEHFDGLPVHTVQRLAYYSLLHSEFQPGQQNQLVVDISSALEKKMLAIQQYKTQFPPEKQYVIERAKAIAQAVGFSAGFSAGEVITSTRAIASTNLIESLLPSNG